MLRQLLVIIILYLLINQLILYYNDSVVNEYDKKKDVEVETDSDSVMSQVDSPQSDEKKTTESVTEKNLKKKKKSKVKSSEETIPLNLFGKPHDYKPNEYIVWTFHEPVPWSQIIYMYNQEFPFKFFIKVKVPSLNDYQTWKQIIPNLEFEARTGELIIPSKNEASALAIANLIISTFQGQLKVETILEKNLIQVSVIKAQQYELVRNKLREQIIESLRGKTYSVQETESGPQDYEQDLARSSIKAHNVENHEGFRNEEPLAADAGEDYSYI